MSEKLLLGADILEATHAALAAHAPALCRQTTALSRRKPLKSGLEARPGESIYAQYDADMPVAEAEAILEALRRIERERGYNATFKDRQINFLVCVWSEFLANLRPRLAQKPVRVLNAPRLDAGQPPDDRSQQALQSFQTQQ